MTIYTFDGFDLEKTRASVQRRYPLSTGLPLTLPDQAGRLGGKAYRAEQNQIVRVQHGISVLSGTYQIGVALRIGNLADPDPEEQFIFVNNGSGQTALSIYMRRDTGENGFRLRFVRWQSDRVTEVVEYNSELLDFNTWFYIELKARLEVDRQGIVLRLNGDTLISSEAVSGFNMIQGHEQTRFRFRPESPSFIDIDDLYISDGIEGYLGPNTQITSLYPNSDGIINDWIPFPLTGDHYTNVDEGSIGDIDDNTTRLDSVNIGDKELFELSKSANASGKVHAIRQALDGIAITADESITPILITSQENLLSNHVLVTSAYQQFAQILTTDPATGKAWNIDQIKDIEIGVVVPSAPLGGTLGLDILLEDAVSTGTVVLTVSDELPILPPIQPSSGLVQGVVANQLPILDPFGVPAWIALRVL